MFVGIVVEPTILHSMMRLAKRSLISIFHGSMRMASGGSRVVLTRSMLSAREKRASSTTASEEGFEHGAARRHACPSER